MSNPYLIDGPALISFSGGRTSGYMLWHILDAYNGKLPEDVHVCFANTGKEREETLRFVHDCATHWGVRVRWLEYQRRERGEPNENGFEEVGYNSAARAGEPFERVIKVKGFLPTAVTRFCSVEMKIRVMQNFMKAQGFKTWNNAVGLRADEMSRVFKAIARNQSGKEPMNTVMPMASRAANVSERDVMAFWAEQPFDLQLKQYEGNCDLCFLKRAGKLKAIIRDDPSRAAWWSKMEDTVGARTEGGNRFHQTRTYTDLVREVATQPLLPLEDGDDDEFDAECGLWCPGEAA